MGLAHLSAAQAEQQSRHDRLARPDPPGEEA